MPTNMRIGLNVMRVANTLAYYDTAIITSVKSFKVKVLGVNVIHSFLSFGDALTKYARLFVTGKSYQSITFK
jgi:hypothetical protein